MKNFFRRAFLINVATLNCLLLASCDKLAAPKTISGEYRYQIREVTPEAGPVERQELYDFRSDGTYAMQSAASTETTRNDFSARGTYTLKGRNVELAEHYFAINGRPFGDKVTHKTFILEQNGDLITESGKRLKKQ